MAKIYNYGIFESYIDIPKDWIKENQGSFFIFNSSRIVNTQHYIYSKAFDTEMPETLPIIHHFKYIGTINYSGTFHFLTGSYLSITIKKNDEIIYSDTKDTTGDYYVDIQIDISQESTITTTIETDGSCYGNVTILFGYDPIFSEDITTFDVSGNGGSGGGPIIG